jgi:hypothetical protein
MASGFPSIGRRQALKALAGSAMAATAPMLAGAEVPVARLAPQFHEPTGALIRRGFSDTDIGLVPGDDFRRLPGDVLG